MPPTQGVDTFAARLAQSGLLTAEQLAAAVREAPVADGEEALARCLVEHGWLTQFQADRLREGRTRGLVFDRYEVTDLLGCGGMSWIYQAQDTATGQVVALKVLLEHLTDDQGMVARLHQEARVGLRLSHPNIVQTLHLGAAGGLPYMIMEYVPGATLLEILLKCQRLPWQLACEFARQAALGLEHAHQRGVVHRDVKPQNLLIDQTGRVRLLDFGLAMVREGETGDEFSMAMIFGHQCVGTAEYIAPEQADDSLAVDGRSDVYSLGATLFAALTGVLPFRGRNAVEMIAAHRKQTPPSVRERVPAIPEEVAAIVAKMLAKRPADRFASAAEAAAALAPWAKPMPLEFDLQAILAERKQQARDRLVQPARSRPQMRGLASSTARPAAVSSVAQAEVSASVRTAGSRAVEPQVASERTVYGSTGGSTQDAAALASRALLVDSVTGRTFPLVRDRLVIGRRDDCDLPLNDASVSSRHCELVFDGFEWWLTDLNSRNGTRVNGVVVTYQALQPGDELLIGKERRFRIDYMPPGASSECRRRQLSGWLATIGVAAVLLLAGLWWALSVRMAAAP